MNNKFPRLVLSGLSAAAVAVLSVFMSKNLHRSVQPVDANSGEDGSEVAENCCTLQGGCRPCHPPPAVVGVRS